MRYQIKRGSNTVATIRPEGRQQRRIMAENTLSVAFSLFTYVNVLIGDYITYDGQRYYFKELPTVKKVSNNKWEYQGELKSKQYDLAEVQFFMYDSNNELQEGDFSLMANAETFIDLLVTNANRVSSGWTKGVVDATIAKNLTFSNQNCLSALSDFAEAFETEWWIENQVIHLSKREGVQNFTFEYGRNKGLYNITRQSVANSNVITRLYAFGSDKNLPSNYRGLFAKRLRMPVGINYLEDNVDKFGIIEHTEIFDDVYPHRTGTVTEVDPLNPLKFTDATMEFNVNDYLISGLVAKVIFQTGQLAGYEIELQSYNHSTKTFTVNVVKDEKSVEIPSELIRPAVEDKYILVDITMPVDYITAAELELQDRAQAFLDGRKEPIINYIVQCDKMYFRRENIALILGNYVTLKDVDFDLNKAIRINGYSRDIQDYYNYNLELAETTQIQRIVRQVAAQERIQKAVDTSKINDINKVRALDGTIRDFVAGRIRFGNNGTSSIVDGNLITSGTMLLGSEGGDVETGITGIGEDPESVMIWSGASFANRDSAVFRVQKDGKVFMSNASIQSSETGKRISIDGSENNLKLFDGSGNEVLRIDDDNALLRTSYYIVDWSPLQTPDGPEYPPNYMYTRLINSQWRSYFYNTGPGISIGKGTTDSNGFSTLSQSGLFLSGVADIKGGIRTGDDLSPGLTQDVVINGTTLKFVHGILVSVS
ncbi:phage tail protein [Desertivirga xinjiangensis]|uniref:phage tail protein n=1 Tax=Desertivirga xinjiangensis TaxID=539206 RepID=UPI002109AC53|nr:phage tail protein [Pedobacter xinjiangensis]